MNAPIWTKAALAVALSLSAASPVGAQGAATPARGLRTPTPRPDLAAPAEKVRTPNLPSLADTRPRVPDVVGLRVDTALARLSTAGYQVDLRYLDVPDATIPHGFVKRMVPAAGTIQTGGRVAIEIPRPASKVGSAVLSIADFARNAGFDLDTGRYEAVDHGADLVLSKHDQTPIVDAAGKTTYDNFTIFADGGSGAVFRKIDGFPSAQEIGSYAYYSRCQDTFSNPREHNLCSAPVGQGANAAQATICVRTQDGTLSLVLFTGDAARRSDGEYDYQFRYAIFPPSILPTPQRPQELTTRRKP